MTHDNDRSDKSLAHLIQERRNGSFVSQEEGRSNTLAMLAHKFRGRLARKDRLSRDEANER
jgi:predicted membrane GTPase involved in stress response